MRSRATSIARDEWQRHVHLVLLGTIAALSLALRLDIARNTSLWLDETYTVRDVAHGFSRLLLGPKFDHPGLMYAFTKAGMMLFGESDAGVRAASLAFGTAALGAVYLLAVELGFSRARALLALASFSLAPLFVRHGVEARHYSALMLFTTLATLAALRIDREPHRRRHYALLACTTLASLFTHYYGASSIAAVYVALAYSTLAAFRRRDPTLRLRLRRAALAVGPTALAGLVLSVLLLSRIATRYGVGKNELSSSWVAAAADRMLAEFSPLHSIPAVAYVMPVLSLVGLIALLRKRPTAAVAMLACLLFPLAGLASMDHSLTFRPRYAAAAFVVYHLLWVGGLCALSERAAHAIAQRSKIAAWPLQPGRAAGALLGLAIAVRIAQFPAGYSAGTFHHAGLRDYLDGEPRKVALACYVGYVCEQVMAGRYAVGHKPIRLERFRRLRGVNRYLIAEFHLTREREARFEKLVKEHFGLDAQAWNELRPVDLPSTRYQPAVRARLVELPPAQPRPKKRPSRKANRVADGPREHGADWMQ